ncbi:MAG: sensor histidine kinase/respose regulator [Moraxellaceae bacterium]|nr:sensor histidine kinase/respose regulator [Moraxellaceae bacterium]
MIANLARRFDDLTIRNRVTLLVAAATFFFLLFFLFSTVVSGRSIDHLDRVGSKALPMVTRLHQVDYQFLVLRDTFHEAISDQDEEALGDARQQAARLEHELKAIAADEPGAFAAATAFAAYFHEADTLAAASVAGTVATDRLYSSISTVRAQEDTFRDRFSAFRNAYLGRVNGWVEQAHRDGIYMRVAGFTLGGTALACTLLLGWWIVRSVRRGLEEAVTVAGAIASGDWDVAVSTQRRDEAGQLLAAIDRMRLALKERQAADRRRELRANVLVQLDECMRGQLTPAELSRNVLDCLAGVLGAPVGVLYVLDDAGGELVATASHAVHSAPPRVALGAGLLGQAAALREFMVLDDLPEDYLTIRCGVLALKPVQIVLVPLVHNDRLVGMLELALLGACDTATRRLLQESTKSIAISLIAALARTPLARVAERVEG